MAAQGTYTCTVFNNQPKSVHVGNNSVGGKMTYFGTVSDILFLAKVPNGAKIVDFAEYHSSGQTAAVLDFGFDRGIAAGGAGNASCVISGGALATMNRLTFATSPSGAPLVVSLSDTDPIRYAILQAKTVSGTMTITISLAWLLTYYLDGPDPA